MSHRGVLAISRDIDTVNRDEGLTQEQRDELLLQLRCEMQEIFRRVLRQYPGILSQADVDSAGQADIRRAGGFGER